MRGRLPLCCRGIACFKSGAAAGAAMIPHLFTPFDLGSLVLPNRIAISPMCQYSAADGSATDWHVQHWMTLAMSSAGMITIEATGVERRGRITHGCLGLYSDENEAAARRTLLAARRVAPSGTRFGIQLAHAGRKASVMFPWRGGKPLTEAEDAWPTIAPSAIPFDDGWHVPEPLDRDGIAGVVEAFVQAARRADAAGFDFVEIHGAHGYLIHEFLSPFSNKRTDEYGGPLENRMRLLLEVAHAVRAALPARLTIGARLSGTEWVEGGFSIDEAVIVARALKDAGVAFVCASSGGNFAKAQVPFAPLYQVHLAEKIRREAGMPTRAVGLITEPSQAEAIVSEGKADIVALARAILADPRWPWRAAAELGAPILTPPQYARAIPTIEKWSPRLEQGRATAA
jgi:2,4-dienoyl-CoA reductase-like NADH-dependent reductase (Old Yellow Enzyme family)